MLSRYLRTRVPRLASAPITASRSFSSGATLLRVPDESKPADQETVNKATMGIVKEDGKDRETDVAPGHESKQAFKEKAANVEKKTEQVQNRAKDGEPQGKQLNDGLNTPDNDSVEIGNRDKH